MKTLLTVAALFALSPAFAADPAAAPAKAAKPAVHRYLIERTFPPGALAGLDAAAKAKVNATNGKFGVRWVTSYANADETKTFFQIVQNKLLWAITGSTAAEIASVVDVCLAELDAQHAHTAAVIANRCEPGELADVAEALRKFSQRSYVLPDEPLLSAPTVAELEKAVGGTPVSGEESLREREVTGVLVAGMTADHVLERLRDDIAVITPGDRSIASGTPYS